MDVSSAAGAALRDAQIAIVGALEPNRAVLAPFLLGTVVGGLAGAVAGTLLSERTRGLLLGLIELSGHRLSNVERDRLKFELLLQ